MLEPVNATSNNETVLSKETDVKNSSIKPNEKNDYERTPNNDSLEISTKPNNKRKIGILAGV